MGRLRSAEEAIPRSVELRNQRAGLVRAELLLERLCVERAQRDAGLGALHRAEVRGALARTPLRRAIEGRTVGLGVGSAEDLVEAGHRDVRERIPTLPQLGVEELPAGQVLDPELPDVGNFGN